MLTETNDMKMLELVERLVLKVEEISHHLSLYSEVIKKNLEEEEKADKRLKAKTDKGFIK